MLYRARRGFDQRPQFQLAALYLLRGFSSRVIIDEIELVGRAVAIQFQAEKGAAAHCTIQAPSQRRGRGALASEPSYQPWVADKFVESDITGVALLLVQNPEDVKGDLMLSEVVDIRQNLAEKHIGNRSIFSLKRETAERFHSKLGLPLSNFSRFSNFAIRSRKKRATCPIGPFLCLATMISEMPLG